MLTQTQPRLFQPLGTHSHISDPHAFTSAANAKTTSHQSLLQTRSLVSQVPRYPPVQTTNPFPLLLIHVPRPVGTGTAQIASSPKATHRSKKTKDSGLHGRGGAGFPSSLKRSFITQNLLPNRPSVCSFLSPSPTIPLTPFLPPQLLRHLQRRSNSA